MLGEPEQQERAKVESQLPLNDLQADIVHAFALLEGTSSEEIQEVLKRNQGSAGEWLGNMVFRRFAAAAAPSAVEES